MLRGAVEVNALDAARASGHDSPTTVLVVEDERALRLMTVEILERNGYAVLEAGDGEAALDVSNEHDGVIDILLTDVVMPRMQGTELADAIRLRRPEIVIIYMTGYAKEAFRERGVRPVALVEKPVTEQHLLEVLRQHLSS
jgi:two-component system, cell cycle sensor histidine kinase and response regulator CckA